MLIIVVLFFTSNNCLTTATTATAFLDNSLTPADNVLAYYYNRRLNSTYRDEAAAYDFMKRLADGFQNQARLYSIGRSVKGHELWVISLASHSPEIHVPLRPEIVLVANMHGDEAVGRELMLNLAYYLLWASPDKDPLAHLILSTSRIHILPSMNPDGFKSAILGQCDSVRGRENANRVDLNRDFPFRAGNDEKISGRQPETEAIIKWHQQIEFALAANFHGGALVANYPFDSSFQRSNRKASDGYAKAPGDDVLRYLASRYANNHADMMEEDACDGEDEDPQKFQHGITNGAKWYAVEGSLQDYQYARRGAMALTLEISCCKYPSPEKLPRYWLANKAAILALLLSVHKGVRGFVLDPFGRGVKTALRIVGRDVEFSSSDLGDYYRILLPGSYAIQIKPNELYASKTIDFVISKAHPSLDLNISVEVLKSNPTYHFYLTYNTKNYSRTSIAPSTVSWNRQYNLSLSLSYVLFIVILFILVNVEST